MNPIENKTLKKFLKKTTKPLHCRNSTTLVKQKVALLFEKNAEEIAEVYIHNPVKHPRCSFLQK